MYSNGRPGRGRATRARKFRPRSAKTPSAECRLPGRCGQHERQDGPPELPPGDALASDGKKARVVLGLVLDRVGQNAASVTLRACRRTDGGVRAVALTSDISNRARGVGDGNHLDARKRREKAPALLECDRVRFDAPNIV